MGLLIACGGVGLLFGAAGLTNANGAVQEIEGLIGVLIVTVVLAGLYIGASISQKAAAQAPFVPPFPPPPPPPR